MSYLNMIGGVSDVSQAIISFWFRVPKETLDAVTANWQGVVNAQPFDGITPLVVFGDDTVNGYNIVSGYDQFLTYHFTSVTHIVEAPPDHIDDIGKLMVNPHLPPEEASHDVSLPSHNKYELGTKYSMDPCYIGIDCNQSDINSGVSALPNLLRINIQLSSLGTGSGVSYNLAGRIRTPEDTVGYAG